MQSHNVVLWWCCAHLRRNSNNNRCFGRKCSHTFVVKLEWMHEEKPSLVQSVLCFTCLFYWRQQITCCLIRYLVTGDALHNVHWADLAKCECIVGGCTGPAEVRPPLCASVQSALGLRAPRSRSPPYHLPTPPGSPAVWWTLASLMETAQRDIPLEILLLLHFFRALLFYILNIWLSPVCESWRGSNKLSCRSTTKHFTNNRPRLEEK